jgi:hypothetical protein
MEYYERINRAELLSQRPLSRTFPRLPAFPYQQAWLLSEIIFRANAALPLLQRISAQR